MANVNYDGTNIVGAPIRDWVKEQIDVRQERLGKTNKNNWDISWENSKTAYVALASSVNINNTLIARAGGLEGEGSGQINYGGEDTTNLYGYSGIPTQAELDFILGEEFTTSEIVLTEDNDGIERIKALELPGDQRDYFGNFLARNLVLYGGSSYYDERDKNNSPNPDGSVLGPNFRSGVANENSIFNKFAYGFGGSDQGLVPMPGITSFNVKSKNMGSLRDVSITIRANNEEQFKLIDNLYCRIGYSMFVEWGNTIYFKDNLGKSQESYQTYDSQISLIPAFLSGKITENGNVINLLDAPTKFIKQIEKRRESTSGNYDGFFGRVKNFSWEFKPEGGYWEISLSLISWGDIIESLTIDQQYGKYQSSLRSGVDNPNNSSALSTFLSIAATPEGTKTIRYWRLDLVGQGQDTDFKAFKRTLIPNSETTVNGWNAFIYNTYYTMASNTIDALSYTRLPTSYNPGFDPNGPNSHNLGKIVSGHAQFADQHYYYIRFGDILDFIRDRLLLYTPGNDEAIVDIDTDTLKNICYSPGVNVSADPSKVMVNNPIPYGFGLENFRSYYDEEDDEVKDWEKEIWQDSIFRLPTAQLENFQSKFAPDGSGDDFPLHGKIMNIYFEYQYLIDTIEELRDENTTKIPLYDFLDKLLQTANSCLGGVNKLSLRLEDDRILRIYDQTPIPGTQAQDNTLNGIINLFGIKPTDARSGKTYYLYENAGSFVTDVNIKTELTNEFSTTVSVGAQAQGSTIGEDATGLSRWNFGLQDRYYPTKIDALSKNNNTRSLSIEERIIKIREQLKFLWFGYAQGAIGDSFSTLKPIDFINGADSVWDQDDDVISFNKNIYLFRDFPIENTNDFIKLQKDWLQLLILVENEVQNATRDTRLGTNQIGMIPINIQITMDGLSGIRIYDKLELDARFLPSYYPQTLYWIIKGVSHEITDNKWYTKLETIAVPKISEKQNLKFMVTPDPYPPRPSNTDDDGTGGGSGGSGTAGSGTGQIDGTIPVEGDGIDALKYFIGEHESRNKYEIANNGTAGRLSSTTITDKTVGDLLDIWTKKTGDERVFAMGRMQIIPDTLASALDSSYVKTSNVSRASTFNSVTQEVLFSYLIYVKRPQLGNYIRGNNAGNQNHLENAINSLGYEWAFAPVVQQSSGKFSKSLTSDPNWRGANYGGSAGNPSQSKFTIKQIAELLIEVRTQITGTTPPFTI